MPIEPGQRLLHYRLIEEIGEANRLARFEREARLLASLSHAGIAAVYGLHECDGTRFLAMERVEGQDLRLRLARGRLPVDRRADTWALGCLLYETLTGKLAFGGETVTDTLAAVVRSEPDWDARLEIDEALAGATAFDTTAPSSAAPQAAGARRRAGWAWALGGAPVTARVLIRAWAALRPRPLEAAAPVRFEVVAATEERPIGPSSPALSPDGRHVLISRWRTSLNHMNVAVASLDTGEIRDIVTRASFARFVPPNRLRFTRAGAIVRVSREGEIRPLDLEPGPYVHIALSPDGRQLAATEFRNGRTNVVIHDLSRGVATPAPIDAANAYPVWGRDGREILYRRGDELTADRPRVLFSRQGVPRTRSPALELRSNDGNAGHDPAWRPRGQPRPLRRRAGLAGRIGPPLNTSHSIGLSVNWESNPKDRQCHSIPAPS